MKITVLAENTTCREDLFCEHGLSLFIETKNHKILFDSGQSELFSLNAEKLGIDLAGADMAILSHGHYDHGGGMQTFLNSNGKAKIYVNQNAFRPYYNGTEKYIGLDASLQNSDRLVLTADVHLLDRGLTLATCNEKSYTPESFGLNVLENGVFRPDDFRHEQYLLIEEEGKRVLISGCSHKGIIQITRWFTPDVLVGGFHLKKVEDPTELENTARKLLAHPTTYYTGHCTGQRQFTCLKTLMGEKLHAISTGTVLEL